MSSCLFNGSSFAPDMLGLPLKWVAAASAMVVGYSLLRSKMEGLPEGGIEVALVAFLFVVHLCITPSDKLKTFKKHLKEDSLADEATATRNPHAAHCSSIQQKQLNAAAWAGDLDRCSQIVQEMEESGDKPTEKSYNILMTACSKVGDADGAEKYLQQLANSGQGTPDVISMNIMIAACAKSGDLARAESWIPWMLDQGIQPNVISYNSVLRACVIACNVDRAELWLNKMWAEGITPNEVTYGSMLNVCAKAGVPSRADEWLADMEKKGIQACSFCYGAVMEAWAKVGDSDRCQHLFNEMTERGIVPTSYTYSYLIHAFAKAGDFMGAEAALDAMDEAGVSADAVKYGQVLGAYSKVGNMEGALAIFERMCRRGIPPNSMCCNFLLDVLIWKGEADAVVEQLQNMRKIEICGDRGMFNKAIKTFAQAGDASGLFLLLQEMRLHGQQPINTNYTSILAACRRNKDSEKAEAWLSLMLEESLEVDVSVYSLAIEACLQAGNKHRAEELVWKMDVQIFEQWLHEKHTKTEFAYDMAVQGSAKKGDAHGALKWVAEANGHGFECTEEAYAAVIGVCLKAGLDEPANRLLCRMAGPLGVDRAPPGLDGGVAATETKQKPQHKRGAWAAYMQETSITKIEHVQLNASTILQAPKLVGLQTVGPFQ